MQNIDNKNDDINKYNGLMTRIWGPHIWESIHCITFGYPVEPTKEDITNFKNFFTYLGSVLPCKYCRDSYHEFIKDGNTKIDDNTFTSRENATKWAYNLHEKVNKKLGITYNVSYEDTVDRYEKYRAKCDPKLEGCIMPVNDKTESYKKHSERECVIIPSDIAKNLKNYAENKYGISFEIDKYIKWSENINSNEWKNRNKECLDILKNMRNNCIYGLDKNGDLVREEIILISKLCSSLCVIELENFIKKINNKKENKMKGGKFKIYKLKFL
jgi:hypothetical protein